MCIEESGCMGLRIRGGRWRYGISIRVLHRYPGGSALEWALHIWIFFGGGGGCLNVGEMWHAVIGCEMLGVGRMRGLN